MGFWRDLISVAIANVPVDRLLPGKSRTEMLEELREKLPSAAEMETASAPTEPSSEAATEGEETSAGVSDSQTLAYQLDRLIDDALHLETEHLPNQGRIGGLPCDCIAKAGRDLRRHAKETIPIATRQGKPAKVYSDAANWADMVMAIGTLEAVESGKYDQQYLEEAGTASRFRKEFERQLAALKVAKVERVKVKVETAPSGADKKVENCPSCGVLEDLRDYAAKRGIEG